MKWTKLRLLAGGNNIDTPRYLTHGCSIWHCNCARCMSSSPTIELQHLPKDEARIALH